MHTLRHRSAVIRWAARPCLLGCAWLLLAIPACTADPEPVPVLLQRSGKLVEKFVEQISGVRCQEQILQTKLGKNGKAEYKEEAVYDSLVLVRVNGDDLTVEESRLAERRSSHSRELPLLVTRGFSTFALVFHPFYQSSFEFTRLEDEMVGGQRRVRLQFQHVRGASSPAALELHGREYPLELSGVAWLDPESGGITRIRAGLPSSLEDLNLRAFQADVQYAPVRFSGIPDKYWLPAMATIDVESPRQHWRNVHHFGEYRRYTVNVEIEFGRQP